MDFLNRKYEWKSERKPVWGYDIESKKVIDNKSLPKLQHIPINVDKFVSISKQINRISSSISNYDFKEYFFLKS